MLTAIARASGDVAFSLYAGETKVTIPAIGASGGIFNRGWNDQFVEFEVEQAGAVKIGVQGVPDKQHNWMSFSNFRLVQLAPAPTTYAITVAEGIEGGKVEADVEEAEAGATVTLTITPNEGYELTALSVKAGEDDVEVAEGYTFVMPAAAVTVFATFKNPNDYTNMIVNADLTGEGGFDATGTKGIDGSGVVKVGNAAAFDFKQTIANLPAGQYKLTAQAAYRYGGDEAAEAAAIAGGTETKLVQLYATVGETTVAAPVQNRYDGASETDYANGEGSVVVNEKYVPNSTNAVKAWFAADQYVNKVIFNIAEAGDVTIGINRTGTPESDYTVIGPWTLTRLGDAVVPNPTYEIAIKGGIENGTVEADATEAEAGATVKLTITPAEGYELKSISISYGEDEDAKTIEPDEENSFIMPAAPVVIDAVFSEIIPDIVLSAPTFNMESGTQNEPSLYPAGTALKVTYTAENLEANGLTADDVQVKILVMLSGDLPEETMNMQSETKHSIMPPQTFYIPLGETDFPEALKNGYVYQSINILSAELVKPETETEPEEILAAYVGAPVSLRWVGLEAEEEEIDPNLIEIAQDQGKTLDTFTRTDFEEGEKYNTYTANGDLNIAIKMLNVDVANCDYVIVKFAEPVARGWHLAFWGGQELVAIPEGATEYKYVFADDNNCAIQNGVLPQICMMTFMGENPTYPLVAKVKGLYKHLDEEGQVQINDIDAAKAKRNGKFYKKGQFVILNGGKAFSLNGIETK